MNLILSPACMYAFICMFKFVRQVESIGSTRIISILLRLEHMVLIFVYMYVKRGQKKKCLRIKVPKKGVLNFCGIKMFVSL